MACCAIKVCRNYKGRLKTSKTVTYHRLPKNPILRRKWIDVIRKSRDEEDWQATKSSLICSNHFRNRDMNFTNKRCRLKKDAVPCKALFLSSLQSDESDASYENTDKSDYGNTKNTLKRTKSIVNIETGPCLRMVDVITDALDAPKSLLYGEDNKNTLKETENETEVLQDFTDSPKKAELRKVLRRKNVHQEKNILTRRKNIQLKKKLLTFKDIVSNLKRERYIDNDIHQILSSNIFTANLYAIMNRKIKNGLKKPVLKYSKGFRKFCLILHFFSPKAYSYARNKFETCLPHPKTMSKWYANIDGSPGLTEESFRVLKAKRKQCDKNMICALMTDEIAIRQQKCFNLKTGQDEGLIDIGIGSFDNVNIKASEAYVLLLVSLTEPWKLPLAYFLVHGMTGEQKASIIKTVLYRCHESGVDVVSITFDGQRSNLSAMEILGCNFNNPQRLKTTFKHPCADYEVGVFLDICHMLKLIRNHFASKEIFSYKDKEIKWEFVTKLAELQDKIDLHLPNKVTKNHIRFRNSITNVKLATQLLSRSVSEALKFCRLELNVPDFIKSEATERFILQLNNIFDIFNSRNLLAHSLKQPLFPGNKTDVFSVLDEVQDLFLNLKISRKRTTNDYTSVLKSQSFTGFIGVLICINSLKFLYETLIESKQIKFLSTYRISQDHLELFFGAIRMHGGYNDNPNANQLKGIYRKLLCHMELKSVESENCVPLENVSILTCPSSLYGINATVPYLRINDANDDESAKYTQSLEEIGPIITSGISDDYQSCEYIQHIVGYVADFVVRSLQRQIKCMSCIELLSAHTEIYVSKDVYEICKTTETILCKFLRQNSVMTRGTHLKILSSIIKKFIGRTYFRVHSDHICGTLHQNNLLRLVAEKYINIRCSHIAKMENIKFNDVSKRKLFKTQIQRKGY